MNLFLMAVVLFIDNSPDRLDTDDLREYANIYFDPRTLETYWNKGDGRATKTGYTFEAATWRGVFGNLSHFQWPWLNPLSFATADTAAKAAEQARLYLAGYEVSVEVVENNRITGPFSRTVERQLVVVAKNGQEEAFSAGQFADRYMIRNVYNGTYPGESAKQFRAECARAGLIVQQSALERWRILADRLAEEVADDRRVRSWPQVPLGYLKGTFMDGCNTTTCDGSGTCTSTSMWCGASTLPVHDSK